MISLKGKAAPPPSANKIAYLRWQLVRTLVVYGGAAAASMAVAGMAAYIADDYDGDFQKERGMLSQLSAERDGLRAQLDFVNRSSDVYDMLQKKQSETGLDVDREKLSTLVNALKATYPLAEFSLNVNAVADSADPALKRPHAKAVTSSVTLTASGLSDSVLLTCLHHFMQMSPGFLALKQLSVTRTGNFSETGLQQVVSSGVGSIATLKAEYDWIGIRETSTTPAAPGAPTSAPASAPTAPVLGGM